MEERLPLFVLNPAQLLFIRNQYRQVYRIPARRHCPMDAITEGMDRTGGSQRQSEALDRK